MNAAMFRFVLPLAAVMAWFAAPLRAENIDDFMPSVLAGKTLSFTIDYGYAPLATTGVWTATIGTGGMPSFTVANVNGDTAGSAGTLQSLGALSTGGHSYRIFNMLPSGGSANLTIWLSQSLGGSEGIVSYMLTSGSGTQSGTVVITGDHAPKIAVQQPAGVNLISYSTKRDFGTVTVGKSSVARTFVIRNNGSRHLTGLVLKKYGASRNDFVVGPLDKTSVAPGATARFKVVFKPKGKGLRGAGLAIASNDKTKNPFAVGLTGTGR